MSRATTGTWRALLRHRFMAAVYVAIMLVMSLQLIPQNALLRLGAEDAAAADTFDNTLIATTALDYVGQYGGAACVDAGKSGYTGGTPLGSGDNDDGECRAFVNCIVWLASNKAKWVGGGGGDYFASLANNGVRITDINHLAKGDVVQVGHGTHTFIIVGRNANGKFMVVDSNHASDHKVMTYERAAFTLNDTTRAYRLGSVASSGSTTPAASTQRIGVMGDGTLAIKEGVIGATWQQLATGVSSFQIAGNRVGILQNGTLSIKEGALSNAWVTIANGVTDFRLEGTRIAVLFGTALFAKDGSVYSNWNQVATGVNLVELSAGKIGILQGSALSIKEGALSSPWVTLAIGVRDFRLEGNWIAAMFGGDLYMKDSTYSSWVHVANQVSKVELTTNRIGVLGYNGWVSVKEGGIGAVFVPVASGATDFRLEGSRVAVLFGPALAVKEPTLGSPWTTVASSVQQMNLAS